MPGDYRISNVCQCLWSNITWVCANLGFIVHTLCYYCEMVATNCCRQQGIKSFGGDLKCCKSRMRVQHLGTNKYISLVSCGSNLFTSCHCLLKSSSIVHGYLLEHIQLWNQDLFSYGVWNQSGVDYIVSPFPEHNYWSCGMDLYKLSCTCCSRGITYLVEQADLSGSGLHKLIALSLIH